MATGVKVTDEDVSQAIERLYDEPQTTGSTIPGRAGGAVAKTSEVHPEKVVEEIINPETLEKEKIGKDLEEDVEKAEDKALVESLTVDQRKLLDLLDMVNGQDAYSNETSALGALRQSEYLVLPTGFAAPVTAAKDVGDANSRVRLTKKQIAQIYALNKKAATESTKQQAVTIAMIRMEAVKNGWVANQKEIRYEDPPNDAMATFVTDLATVKDNLSNIRTAAFLIPLVAEHTFRTLGHHYLTGLSAEYQARYRQTLRACLQEQIASILVAEDLYHYVLHWVSPARAWQVLKAQAGTRRIPEALALRMSAAPAGCALVTTTAAVLDAMDASNLSKKFEEEGAHDFKLIRETTAMIKANPPKFHRLYYAYGIAPASDEQKAQVDAAKAEAAKFAPIAQGFIDALFKTSALGRAQALRKHADQNPLLRDRARVFFKAISKEPVANVKAIYAANVTL